MSVSYHDLIGRDAVVIVVVEASIFAWRLRLGGGLLLVPAALEVQVTHFHQRDQTGRPLQLPVDLARRVPVARAFAALIAFGRPRLQANTVPMQHPLFDPLWLTRASREQSPPGWREREEKSSSCCGGFCAFSMRRPDAFQFGPRVVYIFGSEGSDCRRT